MAGFVKTKGRNDGGDTIKSTDSAAVEIPSGGTSARPAVSKAGDLRFNTDTSKMEYYDGSAFTQFSKEGERLRSYRFHGIFPIEVSAIHLAWDADTVQEFTSTFTYDYWTVEGQAAAAGGSTTVGPTIELNLNIGL